ncbi:MAG TPA: cupin domain-containing protein [Polyangiales bacterium]|nr:cupin domain-containing protein [Polyangiales bacterium]
MTGRERELLEEYVLGRLSQAEESALLAALARSPELRRELAALRELAAASLNVGEVRPRPQARAALLRALDGAERRFAFVPDLVKLFDLGAERVRALLRLIDDAAQWEAGPIPGIFVMHFDGGPNALAADNGFVRLAAGLQFPMHRHFGPEVNYVLEGALRDGDGTLYLPGEGIVKNVESSHAFSVPDSADALIAVSQAGFEIIPAD